MRVISLHTTISLQLISIVSGFCHRVVVSNNDIYHRYLVLLIIHINSCCVMFARVRNQTENKGRKWISNCIICHDIAPTSASPLGFPTQSARFSRSHEPWLKYGRIALDGNAGNQSEILPRYPLQTAALAVRAGCKHSALRHSINAGDIVIKWLISD